MSIGSLVSSGPLILAVPVAAAAGAVTFAVSPQWWFPSGGNRELHWTAWEQAVGSSYVIFAAVVLLAAACLPLPGMRLRSHSTRSPSPPR